jgi:O-antigen/teichoic acid export membrane protein
MITQFRNYLIGNWTQQKSTILKNTAWLTVAELGSRVLRGGLSLVAARFLGAEGLGVFTYAIALGGFFTFFEDVGVSTYITRSFAQKDHALPNVVASGFVLKIILSLTACILFVSIGPHVSTIPEARTLIPLVALLIIADGMRSFFYAITRGQERMKVDSLIQIGTNVLITTLGVLFILYEATPVALALGYVIGSSIGTIALFLAVKKYIPSLISYFSRPLFKRILYAAWPFTVLAASNMLIFNTDSLFISYYGTAADVGLYGAASRLVMMFYILSSLFSVATFPAIVHKVSIGESIREPIIKSILLMLGIALPRIGIMVVGAAVIMNLLFGSGFNAGAPILALLAFTYVPVFIQSMLRNAILAKELQNYFVGAHIAGVIVNIGLDFLLVPQYLGVGAAIASVAGLGTITIITALQIYKYLPAKKAA